MEHDTTSYMVTIFGIQVYIENLNINSYPKNMSPCNDFITYFFVDEMDIFTCLSRASIATYAIRLFTAWVINQSERGKSIKYVIRKFILFKIIFYVVNTV